MNAFAQPLLGLAAASSAAEDVDVLLTFLTLVSVAITLLLFCIVLAFVVRYRRRQEDEVPSDLKGSNWLEISCAAGLLGVFMVFFAWGAHLYIQMKRPPEDALEIDVVGKQWMWKVQHPGGHREINELHVPLGQPVKLVMTSEDAIHSFGIPAFRIKQDVLPNRFTTQWFVATRVGTYDLFCQEYCGTDHSQMRGKVFVMEPQDYAAWLASVTPEETPVERGAKLFVSYGCVQCHGQVAPTLAGLYGQRQRMADGSSALVDDTYLRESILNPPARVVGGYSYLMPSYRGQLNEEQVSDLVAYIKSLKATTSDSATPPDSAAPTTRPTDAGDPMSRPNLPPAREPPSPQLRGRP